MRQTRNLHFEAASQIAYARHALELVKMGAYKGETAEQMRANAEFILKSADYKSDLARSGATVSR